MRFRNLCRSLLLLALGMAACAFAPPKPTAQFSTALSAKETALFVEKHAMSCWAREASFLLDGILVDARKMGDELYLISASRTEVSDRFHEPFLTIKISKSKNGLTQLWVSEGDYVCSFTKSCHPLNLTEDLKDWVAGGDSCNSKQKD